MKLRLAGALLAAVVAMPAISTAAPARVATPSLPATPPRLLNIVRVRVKPRAAETYAALEAQIVRAYERAKARLYWVCLQSMRDPGDVLYLNFYDSQAAADRATATYNELVKQHAELVPLHERLRTVTQSTVSMLATRRDDVDRATAGVDFATMRRLRLTFLQVRPGREGDFLDAIRTASPKSGSWLVYEANDASEYALATLKRTSFSRRDGSPVPRSLRRFDGLSSKVDTRVYAVRPAMSHVPASFFR